ncbi:putative transcriptional activator protein acu-15 [Glarea lozoyensis 74030]|uniref:Putative transcriptional activator protein acu-15 n=1 Tax=Glarea lozoyensis (strain ATCC 74030 / MF5533) TaxID=1104152 RepID=H0ERX2_GLAL7|nr:putative transcriptional activator protein acu-15 [Glarea lozoyensis 74030]
MESLDGHSSRATSIKLERPIRGPSNPAFGLILPPREVSDRMVNLYFCSFESTTRILHVPTFWAEYRKYWDQQDAVAPDVRLMIFLVVGIGSSLSEWDTDFRELVRQWVYDAEASLYVDQWRPGCKSPKF